MTMISGLGDLCHRAKLPPMIDADDAFVTPAGTVGRGIRRGHVGAQAVVNNQLCFQILRKIYIYLTLSSDE